MKRRSLWISAVLAALSASVFFRDEIRSVFVAEVATTSADSCWLVVRCVDVADPATTADVWACLADSLTILAHTRLQIMGAEGFGGRGRSPEDSAAMSHFCAVALSGRAVFLPEIGDTTADPDSLTAVSRAVYFRMMRGPTLVSAIRFRETLLTPTFNADSTEITLQWPPIMGRFVPRALPQLSDHYQGACPQVFLWSYLDSGDSAHAGVDTVEVFARFIGIPTLQPCFQTGGCE